MPLAPSRFCRDGASLSNRGEFGYYWSSSLFELSPYNARSLSFGSARAYTMFF